MKRKLFGIIAAFLSLGVLGGTAFITADDSFQRTDSALGASDSICTLKLNSSIWGQASAYYTIHYWGGETSTSWPGNKFNGGASASGNAEITATYDETSTHCIIVRWSNNEYKNENEWNRWSYFDSHEMTTKYNYFTNDGWDSCSSKYVAPPAITKFTLTYHNFDSTTVKEEVNEGVEFAPKFYHQEGYRLEGWYTDKNLTSKLEKGTAIKKDYDLYPKYIKANDFEIFVDAGSDITGTIYAYLWRDSTNGGTNNAWPGTAQEVKCDITGLYKVTIDASQSYTKMIINNNSLQTVNIDLDVDGYNNIYTVDSTKDGEGKFNVTVAGGEEYFIKAIKTLAGDFVDTETEEEEVTTNCSANYAKAKNIVTSLNDEDLNKIKAASIDGATDISLAKITYEHWCYVNNDANPYSGGVVSGANIALNFVNDNSIYLIVILTIVSVSFVGFILLKKKKQANY